MDQNFHLIEKYFQGKLDKDELQLFNQKLQQDPAFEQEFRDMKLIRDTVKETSRIKALTILQNTEANLTNQETTKINVSMKRLVSIAASLLIIATVSYFAFSGSTGVLTGEEIVATYYEPYINLRGRVRGEDENLTNLTARAYNAYDVKDYSTSADLFKEVLTSEKSAMNYFYSGISNLEAGNLEVAKNNLNTVMNNFTELKDQAQWYLAMTLFKEGSEDEALANIASLSMRASRSSFVKDAKKVLADLNMNLAIEGGTGEAVEVGSVPDTTELEPNGLIDSRQYQFGKVISLVDGKSYKFFNDYPINDLDDGDVVEFVLIQRRGNGKPMAMITVNMN